MGFRRFFGSFRAALLVAAAVVVVAVAVAVVEPEVVVAETQCVSYSCDVHSTAD